MSTALAVQGSPDMMGLLQIAIEKESAIDIIERLAAMQKESRNYQAEVEFNESMHRCQQKMKRISADCYNPQTKSKYASYSQLDKALRPIYTEEDFSLSFNGADCPLPDHERVLCYVSRGGHTRTYQADVPNDGKGAKGGDVMTKTHASGAAKAYGMRYLLKMIFNVAVGEDDDDGNLGGSMDEKDYVYHRESIEGADSLESLQKAFTAAYREALAAKDKQAMTSLIEKKDARKKELA